MIDYDNVWVCPGCQAIGSEPHAPWCPDWRIEQDREDDYMNREDREDEGGAL